MLLCCRNLACKICSNVFVAGTWLAKFVKMFLFFRNLASDICNNVFFCCRNVACKIRNNALPFSCRNLAGKSQHTDSRMGDVRWSELITPLLLIISAAIAVVTADSPASQSANVSRDEIALLEN